MEQHIEINQIISIIGFAWAIVGIISIALKETNYQIKKKYSLALIITFCLPMVKSLLQYVLPAAPHIQLLESKYLSFLYGPLLYLYVKAVLNEPVKGFKKNGIHFIPFVLSFIALYLLSPTVLHPPRTVTQIFSLQVVTNIPLSLFILNFILFGANQQVIVINQNNSINQDTKQESKDQKNNITNHVVKNSEQRPILSDIEMESLVKKLETYIKNSKIYLDSDLTLEKLANETKITRHKLSYILKKGLNMAFYTYINHYRIEEFKNLVLQGRNKELSILGLTYECGFKGSSSFYSALKKERGITPKQLIKQIENT
ncbi:MAG: hypothetical protein BKP49_07635 [Treponema sp. CETP13]|nr:MAG: hypothetical protein BKP49_07635 [Treponema sp. CETP13]